LVVSKYWYISGVFCWSAICATNFKSSLWMKSSILVYPKVWYISRINSLLIGSLLVDSTSLFCKFLRGKLERLVLLFDSSIFRLLITVLAILNRGCKCTCDLMKLSSRNDFESNMKSIKESMLIRGVSIILVTTFSAELVILELANLSNIKTMIFSNSLSSLIGFVFPETLADK